MQTGHLINGKVISNLVLCGALILTIVFCYSLFSAVVFQHYVTFPLIGFLYDWNKKTTGFIRWMNCDSNKKRHIYHVNPYINNYFSFE